MDGAGGRNVAGLSCVPRRGALTVILGTRDWLPPGAMCRYSVPSSAYRPDAVVRLTLARVRRSTIVLPFFSARKTKEFENRQRPSETVRNGWGW